MKLVHPDLQFQIEFTEKYIPVFIVESPLQWRHILQEFYSQLQGEDGKWVLSEKNTEININKSVEFIYNPILIEENQRKIMNVFLQSLGKTAANENYWKKGQELNTHIQKFFSDLEMEYPFEYHINSEINFSLLAKAMEIRIENQYDSELERLIQYCILTHNILNTKLYILFHLHTYFTEKELQLFYQEIKIRKWSVLLIEPFIKEQIPNEKYYIIDKDNCEIY